MTDQPTVQTASGTVRGRTQDGVATYLGVPYAAPPVGDLRFAEPEPAQPWPGIREASEPGPTAPQNAVKSFFGMDMFAITGSQWRRGDDYLTLNIWAPAEGTGHPVMVYIHGGGLVAGTKDAPVYDGRNFARDGAVAVTINYRLGVEGFLAIPGAPTNLGLRDMLAALRWVRSTIEAFGGDPTNVTVFGESGGAMATACLVTSPLSTGLFRRAIVESGHGSAVYPQDIAHRATRKMAELLEITPDLKGFRSVDSETALKALQQVSKAGTVDMKDENGFDPSFGQAVINPIVGDDVLPRHPLIALGEGAGRDVDLLIGTNEDEFNFWLAPTRLILAPRFLMRPLLRRLGGDADGILAAYRQQNRRARGGQIISRIMSDLAFRWPTRQYAAAHQGRTFFYEFDWDSPASGGRLGAAHGLELPFVFDTLATVSGPRGWLGRNPPQHLADRVHGTWLQFATDGKVPWPEFDPTTRIVHRIAHGVSTSENALPAAAFIPPPAPHLENESV
jgi:para-nitrobenzyl esterase